MSLAHAARVVAINKPLFCAEIIVHAVFRIKKKLQYHLAAIFTRLKAPIHMVCTCIYRLPTSVTNATITAATRTNTGSLSITDTDVREHIRRTFQNG